MRLLLNLSHTSGVNGANDGRGAKSELKIDWLPSLHLVL